MQSTISRRPKKRFNRSSPWKSLDQRLVDQVLKVYFCNIIIRKTFPCTLNVFTICVYMYLFVVIGRILNRFTKDVAIMDDSLPSDAFDFIDVSRPSVIHVYFLVV